MIVSNGNFILIICLIVGLFAVFFIFSLIKEKELEEYLLKNGEEVEAEAKFIAGNWRSIYIVKVSFQINGQRIVKTLTMDSLHWLGAQRGACKIFPVLVDPLDPNRFLFNMSKFQLKGTSNDSVQNFLERHKAEQSNSEESGDTEIKGHNT